MAAYKLKALSICIGGQVFRKGEEPKGGFTEKQFGGKVLKQAADAGFLEEVKSEKPEKEAEKSAKKPEKKPEKEPEKKSERKAKKGKK